MKFKKSILCLVAMFAMLLGFVSIAPSVVSFDETTFSSKNALEHLQVISEKPHSVTDYENHEEIRQYLLNTSKNYAGEDNVFERNYLTENNKNPNDDITYVENSDVLTKKYEINSTYDIRNILVQFEGKNDMGILLVAHYDSRGNIKRYGELAHSYGACDDGYGVSSILEIMRSIKENYVDKGKTLENSLYVLFTDDEEVNMGGSILESHNEELMNKVNFVINIEGRGVNGASYMFETSKKNNKVMAMYQKAYDQVSYSVAPAVYTVMTNYTDFASFLEVGKCGLNFSTLDDIQTYHNPKDTYANVNPSSIQHYGSQILPIVQEYISNSQYGESLNYFEGTDETIFFNFLPGVFVVYSATFGIILSVIIMLALIGYIVYKAIFKKDISLKTTLKKLGMFGLMLVGSILSGYIVSLVVARLTGLPWSLSNVRYAGDKVLFVLFVVALFGLLAKIYKKTTKEEEEEDKYFLLNVVIVNSLFNLVTSIILPGASFLFMIPSLLGIIYLLSDEFIKNKYVRLTLCLLDVFIIFLVFAPLIYSLLLALTLGGLLAFALILFLGCSMLFPIIYNYMSEKEEVGC